VDTLVQAGVMAAPGTALSWYDYGRPHARRHARRADLRGHRGRTESGARLASRVSSSPRRVAARHANCAAGGGAARLRATRSAQTARSGHPSAGSTRRSRDESPTSAALGR
jgi:hypothetical protein